MTTDEQLRDALEKWREGARQAQLRWVTVDKVDKENKAMDVTGVIDQLEYYDVQLGMGALCIYPKPGTTCLVGIIEGQETDAFLISADEVDEIVLNGGTLGGLVKVGEQDFVVQLLDAPMAPKWLETLKVVVMVVVIFFGAAFTIMASNNCTTKSCSPILTISTSG